MLVDVVLHQREKRLVAQRDGRRVEDANLANLVRVAEQRADGLVAASLDGVEAVPPRRCQHVEEVAGREVARSSVDKAEESSHNLRVVLRQYDDVSLTLRIGTVAKEHVFEGL